MQKLRGSSDDSRVHSFPVSTACEASSRFREPEPTPALFDSTAPLDFRLPEGTVSLNFPTDEQFRAHASAIQVLCKRMKRGEVTRRIGGEAADIQLVSEVREDVRKEISGARSIYLADRLTNAAVLTAERDGEMFRVKIRFLGTFTSRHTLSWPSIDQRRELKACGRLIPAKNGFNRVLLDLDKWAGLYDQLAVNIWGYVHGTPIVHKYIVVHSLFDFLMARGN